MPNYRAQFEQTVRTIDGVKTKCFGTDYKGYRSKKAVKEHLEEKAKIHGLENFVIVSVTEYTCLECYDTGKSKYDGTACC